MASTTVQFFGKDNVLSAYDNRGIAVWSIFQGKDLITTGEGRGELEAFMELLSQGGTNAVYKLCIYNAADPDNITNKTECNGSFNFKLDVGPQAGGAVGSFGVGKYVGDPIMGQLHEYVSGEVRKAIDKKLNIASSEDEDEKEDKTIMGFIESCLTNPKKLEGVLGVIGAFKQVFNPGVSGMPMPVSLAGVQRAGPPREVTEAGQVVLEQNEAEVERLTKILDRLERCDPDIIDHLAKLADMAEKNPAKYNVAISLL